MDDSVYDGMIYFLTASDIQCVELQHLLVWSSLLLVNYSKVGPWLSLLYTLTVESDDC